MSNRIQISYNAHSWGAFNPGESGGVGGRYIQITYNFIYIFIYICDLKCRFTYIYICIYMHTHIDIINIYVHIYILAYDNMLYFNNDNVLQQL